MNKNEYSMIRSDEEHDFQFSSKAKATTCAKVETANTGVKHQIILTTTYRDLVPRICWTVILQTKWVKGKRITTR